MSRFPFPTRTVAVNLPAILILISLLTGCTEVADQAATADFAQQIMAADRRFAQAVATAGPADRGRVWATWFGPDGHQIIPGKVVTGRNSIADLMSPFFSTEGTSLTWEPDLASVAADRDMGWTSGRYETRLGQGDSTVVQAGRYLTIWGRAADGTWKVALDTGVPDSLE